MKRRNKTLRRKLQRKQRSRRISRHRQTRRCNQKGGGLPVPEGALVSVSLGGEYGLPVLMLKDKYEAEKDGGHLED